MTHGGPRLLFGLGATKAGTSWLYRWLQGHPDARLRTVKELHYFDTLAGDRIARRVSELAEERTALAAGNARPERLRDIDELRALFADPSDAAYLDYLGSGSGVAGDITPAYGLLSEAWLRRMDGLGDARFLLILRDPVARLWSHVRMIAGRRDPSGAVTAERSARILRRTIRGEEDHIARRSDYRGILTRLFAAIPASRRLVLFFENLFSGDTVHAICDFLGITRVPPLAGVVHGGRPLPMTPDQHRAARDWLAPQYEHVSQAMGRVPAAWTERM